MSITPVLHSTRECTARARAHTAIGEIKKLHTCDDVQPHIDRVVDYLERKDLRDDRQYTWSTNKKNAVNGDSSWDQRNMASAMVHAVAGAACRAFEAANYADAFSLARTAGSHAAAVRKCRNSRNDSPLMHPWGEDISVATVQIGCRGLQSLSTLCQHRETAVLALSPSVAAPGTRLHTLKKVADSAAVDLLTAAELAAARPTVQGSITAQQLADLMASACTYRLIVTAAMERSLDGDGSVGRELWCLRQAAALNTWLVKDDGDHIQKAVDNAYWRNGIRLESEVMPPCLERIDASAYANVPTASWCEQ